MIALIWRSERDAGGRYQVALSPDPRSGEPWATKFILAYTDKKWVLTEHKRDGGVSQTTHGREADAKRHAVLVSHARTQHGHP